MSKYQHHCILLLVTVLYLLCRAEGQTASECPPCDCQNVRNCSAGKVGDVESEVESDVESEVESEVESPEDDCDCCKVCAGIGQDCGEGRPDCIGGLLCLPNDPYSSEYVGKCYELTDCLSFGCTSENDECKCLYSSSCPIKRFPFYTLEECEASLLQAKCTDIVCPTLLTAQDCKEGMYFEQGPSYYDECCPVSGSCVCNVSMCPVPPECSSNSALVMIEKADQDTCCDKYECQMISGCFHDNKQYQVNDTWKETACKECHCTSEGVYCTYINCSQLEECEITYLPEGDCCPVCIDATTLPNIPDSAPFFTDDNACIGEGGVVLAEGEMFHPGPCRVCKCENSQIICEEKVCEPLVCADNEIYGEVEGKCCPECLVVKTVDRTMDEERPQTMPSSTLPVSSSAPTPITNTTMEPVDEVDATVPPSSRTPSTIVPPSDHASLTTSNSIELVVVLDASMAEVDKKWDEFSQKVTSMLNSHNLTPVIMNVREDMGEAVLIISVMDNRTDGVRGSVLSNSKLSESDLAVMVSRTAQRYSLITHQEETDTTSIDSIDSHHHHYHTASTASALGLKESEFNATVIVLTTIAAVGLISFIGVFIGLILITRRLKTIKAIRGQNYKRSATKP